MGENRPPVAQSVGAPSIWGAGGSGFESPVRHGLSSALKEMFKMPSISSNACINPPLHGHPDALMNPWKIPDSFATHHNFGYGGCPHRPLGLHTQMPLNVPTNKSLVDSKQGSSGAGMGLTITAAMAFHINMIQPAGHTLYWDVPARPRSRSEGAIGRHYHAQLVPRSSYAQGVQCFRRDAVLCKFDREQARLPRWLRSYTARRPPRRTGFNPQPGHSRIFASGNRTGRRRRPAGFLKGVPFSPSLHSGDASFSPHLTLIGSQDLCMLTEVQHAEQEDDGPREEGEQHGEVIGVLDDVGLGQQPQDGGRPHRHVLATTHQDVHERRHEARQPNMPYNSQEHHKFSKKCGVLSPAAVHVWYSPISCHQPVIHLSWEQSICMFVGEALNIEVLRADEGEAKRVLISAGMHVRGIRSSPRKPADQRHCLARLPHAKIWGSLREASSLTTTPPRPPV
ncbi:hypothetical protein PR048_002914 [Dryococelus australis]|uniref:Uncharacterized protein n=1 Tax=Dryococelus australis TaxID=614101 RepID=A0ABQ9IN16_9NEOP|nr:hypothetical protein PR048_002914 [Dryococelus australis]